MSHGIHVCRCGAVIRQCRCPGPHLRRVVQDSCAACARPASPAVPTSEERAALTRLLNAALRLGGEPARVHIPRIEEDDDEVLERALDELDKPRAIATAARAYHAAQRAWARDKSAGAAGRLDVAEAALERALDAERAS
jgi:hypothetical protein